jgi:hypothetical protein
MGQWGWAGLSNRRMVLEVEVRSVIRSGVRAVWRHTPGGYRMCEVGESQLGGSVQT